VFTKTVYLEAPGHGSLWVFQLFGVILFFILALARLSGDQQIEQNFDGFGFDQSFRYTIGLLEFASAIFLLIPTLSGIAALLLVLTTMGAILAQLFVTGGSPALAMGLLIVVSVVAWGRKEATLALFSTVPWRRRKARNPDASQQRSNVAEIVWMKRGMKGQAEKLQ
jgi:putative oxidoreductase